MRYQDFVADPIGTAESIYAHFGLPLTAAARTAMRKLHAQSTTGDQRPSHRYALADFGLTAVEVDARFAAGA